MNYLDALSRGLAKVIHIAPNAMNICDWDHGDHEDHDDRAHAISCQPKNSTLKQRRRARTAWRGDGTKELSWLAHDQRRGYGRDLLHRGRKLQKGRTRSEIF